MVKLGTKVKDNLTGFAGIAVSRTEYLYGCVRVGVESPELKEGKPQDIQFFDEQRLEEQPTAISGGPGDVPGARSVPPARDPR
jgi:hypothetical protein